MRILWRQVVATAMACRPNAHRTLHLRPRRSRLRRIYAAPVPSSCRHRHVAPNRSDALAWWFAVDHLLRVRSIHDRLPAMALGWLRLWFNNVWGAPVSRGAAASSDGQLRSPSGCLTMLRAAVMAETMSSASTGEQYVLA